MENFCGPDSKISGALLKRLSEDIVQNWSKRVRGNPDIPSSVPLSLTVFNDDIPALLIKLAGWIDQVNLGRTDPEEAGEVLGGQMEVQRHIRSRMTADYTVKEAILEFGHLRRAIFQTLAQENVAASWDTCLLIDSVFEQATLSYIECVAASREDELHRIADERHQAQQAAEESDRSKTLFIANMSHELRTPLNAILGFSEILGSQDISLDESKHFSSIIARNGQQLTKLIDDILYLARIEMGHLEVLMMPVSLAVVFSEVSEIFSSRIDPSKIQLRFEIGSGVPVTFASDVKYLKQILLNIIGNAIKFTPSGYVHTRADLVVLEDRRQFIKISVEDNGAGIDEDFQKRLFHYFSQGDATSTRKHGGAGLGLSISQKFAEQLGGSIRLERSVLNKGSCFAILIPLTEALGQDPNLAESKSEGEGEGEPPLAAADFMSLSGTKVLVVEDSPDTQFLMTTWLQDRGASVLVAKDGTEAVRLALVTSFDIILMDIHMPLMDGYQATRELRLGNYRGPIVAVTACAMQTDRDKALEAGCDDHISKPIHEPDLIAAVVHHSIKTNLVPVKLHNI